MGRRRGLARTETVCFFDISGVTEIRPLPFFKEINL